MTATPATVDIDVALIAADAVTFHRLAALDEPGLPLLVFPHFCMFAIESFDRLRKKRMARGTRCAR